MNSISITGKGSIHVAPDVTRLETTIEQWFKTYEEAYAQAREILGQIQIPVFRVA